MYYGVWCWWFWRRGACVLVGVRYRLLVIKNNLIVNSMGYIYMYLLSGYTRRDFQLLCVLCTLWFLFNRYVVFQFVLDHFICIHTYMYMHYCTNIFFFKLQCIPSCTIKYMRMRLLNTWLNFLSHSITFCRWS